MCLHFVVCVCVCGVIGVVALSRSEPDGVFGVVLQVRVLLATQVPIHWFLTPPLRRRLVGLDLIHESYARLRGRLVWSWAKSMLGVESERTDPNLRLVGFVGMVGMVNC